VPTISLPPPRRKKSVVTGVPMTPKTSYECQRASSPTDTFPGAGEFGGPGEIMFARVEDTLEDETVFGPANPYLNSPPSPPRYFYPRSDDEEDGADRPSPFYTLEKSRFTRRPIRKRSFGSDQSSLTERKGGRPVSPLYFTALGCNVGPRPTEKGKSFFRPFFSFFFSISVFVFQSVGATCDTDETAALAQPHALTVLLSVSTGAFSALRCFRENKGANLASRLGPLTNHHLPQNHGYPSRGIFLSR